MSANQTEPADSSAKAKRLAVIVGVLVVFAIAATSYSQIETRRADQAQTDLYDSIESAFAGTTSADIEPLYENDVTSPDSTELDGFLSQGGTEPDYIRQLDQAGYEARYSTAYGGQDRCVVATWRATGFGLDRVQGSACKKAPA